MKLKANKLRIVIIEDSKVPTASQGINFSNHIYEIYFKFTPYRKKKLQELSIKRILIITLPCTVSLLSINCYKKKKYN